MGHICVSFPSWWIIFLLLFYGRNLNPDFVRIEFWRRFFSQRFEKLRKSLYVPNFHVNASCKGEGVPKVTPCTKHGGAFHVSGCKPQACLSPRKTVGHGYVVQLGYGSFHAFFFWWGGEKGGNLEVRHSFLEASRLHVKGCKGFKGWREVKNSYWINSATWVAWSEVWDFLIL